MDYATVRENELLLKVNQLLADGLHQTAITLLQNSLTFHPTSPELLSALGHIYLLAGKPEEAITPLKKAIEASQSLNLCPEVPNNKLDETFTDDDLNFLKAQYIQQYEHDYSPYDSDMREANRQTPRPILHLAPGTHRRDPDNPNHIGLRLEYRNRRRIDHHENFHRLHSSTDQQPVGNVTEPPGCSHSRDVSNSTTALHETTHHTAVHTPQIQSATKHDLATRCENYRTFSLSRKVSNEGSAPPDQKPDHGLTVQTSDEPLPDASELDLDLDDIEEDDYATQDPLTIPPLLPYFEETDEIAWDDYEDLDAFDQNAHREPFTQHLLGDTITREMRARQAAAELIERCGWNTTELDLVQHVFMEYGWGVTRLAIEREIQKGMTPEELRLASYIRDYWSNSPRYWTTFAWLKSHFRLESAHATYRHISWPGALRIVRCFPSIPIIEELIGLIDETYE